MMEAAANLAYIAYTDDALSTPIVGDFEAMLMQVPAGRENGPWTLCWGPAAKDGVLLYAARGADGSLGIAFRGTNPANFEAGLEDFVLDILFPLVDWPHRPGSGMQICVGIREALKWTTEARGPDGRTLLEFLQPLLPRSGRPLSILVAGHSFGGALAIAASARLYEALAGQGSFGVVPQTFAAQTAWNEPFARWFGATFPFYAATNANDVIPLMWADLPHFLPTYESGPRLATTNPHIWKMYKDFYDGEKFLGDAYEVIANRFGHRFSLPVDPDSTWLDQAGKMHAMKTAYFPQATQRAAPTLPHSKN